MTGLVTQPYARPKNPGTDNYLTTLQEPYDLVGSVARAGASTRVDLRDFLAAHPDGCARIWAIGVSKVAQRIWPLIQVGDMVVLFGHSEIYAFGYVASKVNWPANNHIWPSGNNWDHIYSLRDFRAIPEGSRPLYRPLRQLTVKLDERSVGRRDLAVIGRSAEDIREYIERSGPRSRRRVLPPKATSHNLFGLTKQEIDQSITVYDNLGRELFLSTFALNPAQRYRIKHGDQLIDAKAIVDHALMSRASPSGPREPSEWSGNKETVARPLQNLGYEVVSSWTDVARAEEQDAREFLESFGKRSERALRGLDPTAVARAIRALDGPHDAYITAQRRQEQPFLRALLLNGRRAGVCFICGRRMDAKLLVAAHIKRRSVCTEIERRNWKGNMMLNCRFGCDELFGRGLIGFSDSGKLKINSSLRDRVALRYIDQHVPTTIKLSLAQRPFFAWHLRHDVRAKHHLARGATRHPN